MKGRTVTGQNLASTITVGGATNAGTFEAAELMAAGMSVREASNVLFEQNLVVAGSESTRRRLASATTKHLSFLEDDALDDFVERQRRVDPAMSTLTVKSGQKVRSVFLRCMRDVGFIDEDGAALPVVIPVGVARLVNAAPQPWGWPMRESFPVAQFQFDVPD